MQIDLVELRKTLFGGLFFVSNKLEAVADRYLASSEMTTRQWMLTLIVNGFGEHPPMLAQAAKEMATSHQSVRQMADKLERTGYMRIEQDPKDSRALRLVITEKCRQFWEERRESDEAFIARLFEGISEGDLTVWERTMRRFYEKVLEEFQKTEERR